MRKLASVQIIKEVKEHPNADRLEILSFNNIGWQCVSRKGEFKSGEQCIFFEIDSLISMKHEWIRFLQDKDKPSAPARLKSRRLRGELSQGLALPINILMAYKDQLDQWPLVEGQDLTSTLEIQKYEPVIPACLNGEVKGARPSYTIKTDKDRIQAFPDLIQEFMGKLVYITQKIDGTSSTFVHKDGEDDVCGRNWSYKDTTENTYWEVAKKYDILAKLREIREKSGKNYAIQSECYGEGIQKNPLGIKGHDLMVFDVYDINERSFLDFYEFKGFCERLQIPTVPILQIVEFKWNIEELLELAKGKYSSGKKQEGIVIVPMVGFNSTVLNGRATFKVINNDYLIENKE